MKEEYNIMEFMQKDISDLENILVEYKGIYEDIAKKLRLKEDDSQILNELAVSNRQIKKKLQYILSRREAAEQTIIEKLKKNL